MNICTNSYHAMEESGGILAITLTRTSLDKMSAFLKNDTPPGNYILLQISDTGCGMDTVTRERIFEPFYTTKTEAKGTGMGLSVVHGIVKECGGTIVTYSEPGKGTTFNIYFPEVSTTLNSDIHNQQATLDDSLPGGKEHIMIVDDEQVIIDLQQRILKKVGYQVTPFTDSALALQAFLKNPEIFDLVITDMTMPKLTGLQLAEQLVAKRPGIPILLCTGHSRISIEELQNCPAIISYLSKPINLRELTETVHDTLLTIKKQ